MTMQQPPTPPPSAPQPPAPGRPPRRLTVVVGVVLAVVLVLGLTLMLVLSGWRDREPDGTITAYADESWRGVMLSIDGPALNKPLQRPLEPWNKYHVPFFVPIGTYQLRATQGERVLFEQQIVLDAQRRSQNVDLLREATTHPIPPTTAATQSTTAPSRP